MLHCTKRFPLEIKAQVYVLAYAQNTNAEKAAVEWFYEDLEDLLELTPPKDVLFIIGYWKAKVGRQEIPGVTGKLVLGV